MGRLFLYAAAVTSVIVLTLVFTILTVGSAGIPSSSPAPSAGTGGDPGAPIGEIMISAFDLGFDPSEVDVPEPGTYTVHFTNTGAILHDLTFDGQPSQSAEPGEMVMFDVVIPEGGTTFQCTVPGHADGGMTGTVTVAGAGGGHEAMTAEEMRDVDAAVTARFPEETSAHGGQLLEPEILADGTKVFELTASVIQWEVEKGHFVEAWAYNGMVPGPEIRVQLGDRVRIVLHNELDVPTTLHSHGLIVPNAMDGVPAITQDAILPGESFTYEFTVRNSGSHMYHSHFMAQRQVPMGLLGAFVVEDPADPPVDVDTAMILNDGPLGFTINGKGFPATAPIVATQGQLIRVRYMNEGLQIHPMHLHGIPQQVIAVDGYPLEHPYYQDTVLVAPGQRVDVLIRASELGVWAFHCHILSHAESDEGMFGMVTALIVTE
ncbi:MAG TPA: multicopper oxidase domain-containing protein [Candidatus Limnocylindria bacterium]